MSSRKWSGPRNISTHAPRAGSDSSGPTTKAPRPYFNPRSPCGERRSYAINDKRRDPISTHAPRAGSDVTDYEFIIFAEVISTHAPRAGSDRGQLRRLFIDLCISTHAPRAGSDARRVEFSQLYSKFQPTLPVRGATLLLSPKISFSRFQPTLPVRGATMYFPPPAIYPGHFNPRSPCGERRR